MFYSNLNNVNIKRRKINNQNEYSQFHRRERGLKAVVIHLKHFYIQNNYVSQIFPTAFTI